MKNLSKIFFPIFLITFLYSCKSEIQINGGIDLSGLKDTKQEITSVDYQNHKLIIQGKNLDSTIDAKIVGATTHTLAIESKTKNELTLLASDIARIVVAGPMNLIISNASGATNFPLVFDLQDGQVTGAKINDMGAITGQILQYN